ncbi:MAG: alpha/beta fold hydrolase [Chloroflexi bacterium]|nr:alpha/beta fold hydrolase [Chloroflexota bacterium]
MKRTLLGLFVAVIAIAGVACGGGSTGEPAATTTPRPVPSPVAYPEQPIGNFVRGDPAFEALPGATAHFGQLGGSIYQIEIPDDWNGRLVLYMHGFRNSFPTLYIDQPSIRNYLIRNGFAWGASSYSNNGLVPGLAADETAALWDRFVQQFGRPARTYVTGHSMGGAATHIAAERYADRYDGGLALCGFADRTSQVGFSTDFFVAGAYVAGVTQAEFEDADTVETMGALISGKIRASLTNPETREQFENILIDLTGGPRAFAREGFFLEEATNWARKLGVALRLDDNQDRSYSLGPLSEVRSDEFNAKAVRFRGNPDILRSLSQGNETTGELAIPLLSMHTTGDGQVPINQQQVLRHKVEAAGEGDLLIQRIVQDSRHCGFTNGEWEQGLADLIAWVEEGKKPAGDDVLADDLSDIGTKFSLAPRFGSDEAAAVVGADKRITLSGTITLDGQPVAGNVFVVVVKDGLRRYCGLANTTTGVDGSYSLAVASDEEARGCGQPGAQLYADVYVPSRGRSFWSQELVTWPEAGGELAFDAALADPGAYRPNTLFRGEVVDSSGTSLPVGTVIEAYIGDTRCGITSLPPTAMVLGDPQTYYLAVVGPDSVAGCNGGEPVTFRVNGAEVAQTGTNDYDGRFQGRHLLDLIVP